MLGGGGSSDGYFTDDIHGGRGSSGWVLMGGQVCHERGKIVVVRVEFIAEYVLDVCFEKSVIEGDAVG